MTHQQVKSMMIAIIHKEIWGALHDAQPYFLYTTSCTAMLHPARTSHN